MSRRRNAVIVPLFLAGALLASQAARAEDGVTDTEIVLGSNAMLTGHFSIFGVEHRVMKAYFDMINDQGGVNGRKIKFLVEDNGCNPQQALLVTRKLVERDHVFAMVDDLGFVNLAVYPYLRRMKVPDLWIRDGRSAYTSPTYPLDFSFEPTYVDETDYFGRYIVKHFPGKKIGFVHGDTPEAKHLSDVLAKAIGDKAHIVADLTTPIQSRNKNAEVLNLKRAGAEIVYMHWSPPDSVAAMKFADEQGYHPQWIMSHTNASNKFLELVGPRVAEGALSWNYVYSESDTNVPGVRKHLQFLKKYLPSEIPSQMTVGAQASAELTVETLRRAGRNLTRESLVNAAESFRDWQCTICISGNSTGPDNHVFVKRVNLLVVRNGKWAPLEPTQPLASE